MLSVKPCNCLSREPDIRVEGNFSKNRYWFFLNTGQRIAQVHPKEELRGPKVCSMSAPVHCTVSSQTISTQTFGSKTITGIPKTLNHRIISLQTFWFSFLSFKYLVVFPKSNLTYVWWEYSEDTSINSGFCPVVTKSRFSPTELRYSPDWISL